MMSKHDSGVACRLDLVGCQGVLEHAAALFLREMPNLDQGAHRLAAQLFSAEAWLPRLG
jgi:hypothetical protein